MTKKKKPKSNYAFIDSQNLNLGVKSEGWDLDYSKFRLYLRNKYKVSEAYLFIGHIAGNEKLYKSLQKAGYILIFKPTLEVTGKKGMSFVKGNVDAELVLHCMLEMSHYDKAVIVSGDGDFHCLIEHLEEIGKLGKVLVPNSHYSSLLRKFSQYISTISTLRRSLQYKKTKISGRSKP